MLCGVRSGEPVMGVLSCMALPDGVGVHATSAMHCTVSGCSTALLHQWFTVARSAAACLSEICRLPCGMPHLHCFASHRTLMQQLASCSTCLHSTHSSPSALQLVSAQPKPAVCPAAAGPALALPRCLPQRQPRPAAMQQSGYCIIQPAELQHSALPACNISSGGCQAAVCHCSVVCACRR